MVGTGLSKALRDFHFPKSPAHRTAARDKMFWRKFFARSFTGTDTNDYSNYFGLWKGEDFKTLGATTFWRAGVLRFNICIINDDGEIGLAPTATVMHPLLKAALVDTGHQFHVLPVIFGSEKGTGKEDPRKITRVKTGDTKTMVIKFIETHEQGHVGLLYVDSLSGQCRYFDYMSYDKERRKNVRFQEIIKVDFTTYLQEHRKKRELPALKVEFPSLGQDTESILGSCGWILAWFWIELLKVSLALEFKSGNLTRCERKRWESIFSSCVWKFTLEKVTEPTAKELVAVGMHCFPQCIPGNRKNLPSDFPVLNLPPRFCLHGIERATKARQYEAFLDIRGNPPSTWNYSSTQETADEETFVASELSSVDENFTEEVEEPPGDSDTSNRAEYTTEDANELTAIFDLTSEEPNITEGEQELTGFSDTPIAGGNNTEKEKELTSKIDWTSGYPAQTEDEHELTGSSDTSNEEANTTEDEQEPTGLRDTTIREGNTTEVGEATDGILWKPFVTDKLPVELQPHPEDPRRNVLGRYIPQENGRQPAQLSVPSYYQRQMYAWRGSLQLRGRTIPA